MTAGKGGRFVFPRLAADAFRGGGEDVAELTLTTFLAGNNVDLVISCTIVCDPFNARWKPSYKLLVEDANVVRRDVVPVDADDVIVFATGLEPGEELRAVLRVHCLGRELISDCALVHMTGCAYDNVSKPLEEIFALLVRPHEIAFMRY